MSETGKGRNYRYRSLADAHHNFRCFVLVRRNFTPPLSPAARLYRSAPEQRLAGKTFAVEAMMMILTRIRKLMSHILYQISALQFQ